MRNISILSLSCVALIGAMGLAYANPKPSMQNDVSKNGSDQMQDKMSPQKKKLLIATRKNPIISIKLQANPSTGYSWYLYRYDTDVLNPISAKYFPPEKAMPGAPGYVLWKFRVRSTAFVVPRLTKIKLIYARPWTLSGKLSGVKVKRVMVVIR